MSQDVNIPSASKGSRQAVPGQLKAASLSLAFGGHSMAGAKSRNDDAFAAHMPPSKYTAQMKGALACIADGVSVSERSHLASQLAVTQFMDDYYATPEGWSVEESASRVLRALNDWLFSQSRHHQTNAMVTTFSSLIVKSNSVHIFHVGDSRIYRVRGQSIEQLTRDHSVNLTRSDSVLTASLGMDPRLAVDYSRLDAEIGDILVLVTDGVLDGLSPAKILTHIQNSASESLDDTARVICSAALEGGSSDNLTCGIVRIDGLPIENFDEANARVSQRKIPPVLKTGNIIDDYKVLGVIHSGTRSHVYKVKDQKSGKNYILKAPSLNFTDDTAYLDAFIREQWIGRRLDHPGLMHAVKATDDSPFLYIVSEYVTGQTLRDWMVDNPKPALSELRDIMQQTISALRQMHRMGMVHRDLKPGNIMISAQGDVKIIDFGTTLVTGMDDISAPFGTEHAIGAVNYSAPEIVLGAKATSRSDIFSLGVIAHEILTGQRPFADIGNKRSKMSAIGDWSYRPRTDLRQDVPNWVFAALEQACSPNPDKRYGVMSEFLEDLKRPGTAASRRDASENAVALLERNPLAFWKGTACLALGLNLILFIFLIQTQS